MHKLIPIALSLSLLSSAAAATELIRFNNAKLSELHNFSMLSGKASLSNTQKNTLMRQGQHPRHQRYQQFYYGIPVIGASVTVHDVNDNSHVTGQVINDITINPEQLRALKNPQNLAQAQQASQQHFLQQQPQQQWHLHKPTQRLSLLRVGNGLKPVIAISFVARAANKAPVNYHAYVDANTHEAIRAWNATAHFNDRGTGGNDHTGTYRYSGRLTGLNVEKNGSQCIMLNHADGFRIVDMRGHYDQYDDQDVYPYIMSFAYKCGDPDRDDHPYFGAASPDNDALFFTQTTIEAFKNWYQERPLNAYIIMRTHFTFDDVTGYPMANAFFDPSTLLTSIGDGSPPEDRNGFFPLTALDVIAHELAHGYTFQHSNLEYLDQSGAMNESFSDMAGIMALAYLRKSNLSLYRQIYDTSKMTWSIGSAIMHSPNRDAALRYMDQPSRDGASADCYQRSDKTPNCNIDYNDILKYIEQMDDMSGQAYLVHTASGIYNHWFYLLATSPNWSVKKAFGLVLSANRDGYWLSNSDFNSAACGVVSAAVDQDIDTKAITEAFDAVGVNSYDCMHTVVNHSL